MSSYTMTAPFHIKDIVEVERAPGETWVFWIFILRLLRLDFETLNKSHNPLGFKDLAKTRDSDFIFKGLFKDHLHWKF